MKIQRRLAPGIALLALPLVLAGCAGTNTGTLGTNPSGLNSPNLGGNLGGGGSFSNVLPAGSRLVDVYLANTGTESPYGQAWVSVQSVEVSANAGKTWIPLYAAPTEEGTLVNLAALKESAHLLGSVPCPDGKFDALRLTLAPTMSITEGAEKTSKDVGIESSEGTPSSDKKAILILKTQPNATPPLLDKGSKQLVVGFDLATFVRQGEKVRPALTPQPETVNLDTRERRATLWGVVANVAETGFDLVIPGKRETRIGVTKTAETALSGAETAEVTLTNGQRVLVQGTWNTATRRINAVSIRVLPVRKDNKNPVTEHVVRGTVGTVDAEKKTFTLLPQTADVRPGAREFTVALTETTQLKSAQKDATLTDITPGAVVFVFGQVSAERQAITAVRIEILPAKPDVAEKPKDEKKEDNKPVDESKKP